MLNSMNKLVDHFARATQIGLNIHEYMPYMISMEALRTKSELEHLGWIFLNRNSHDVTKVISPDGEVIKIDREGNLTVYGPRKEVR
jgi:hypothetical protein